MPGAALSYRKILVIFLSVLVGVLGIGGAASLIVAQATVTAARQEVSSVSTPMTLHTPNEPSMDSSSPASTRPVNLIPENVPSQAPPSPEAPTILPEAPEASLPAIISEPASPVSLPPIPDVQCPTGIVTAGVTQVDLGTPTDSGDYGYLSITAHGSVNNNSSAAITFYDRDIPNLEGLDSRGSTVFFEEYGEYSYVPPAGEPRPSQLTLEPGQSMAYKVFRESEYQISVAETKFWHNDLDSHSFAVYFVGAAALVGCDDPRVVAPASGQSIPNPYKPAS